MAKNAAILVLTSIYEFYINKDTKLVFSVIIYFKPEGYSFMYWESEKISYLKLWDFSQNPKVSFWHNFIISSELFWGSINSLAKNFEKLAEAKHF